MIQTTDQQYRSRSIENNTKPINKSVTGKESFLDFRR